jgi:hypothetical protein
MVSRRSSHQLTDHQNKNQQALRLEKALEIAIQIARALKARVASNILKRFYLSFS